MLDQFPYSKHQKLVDGAQRWRCTIRHCKAHVITNRKGVIIKCQNSHDHKPMQYVCTQGGLYVRVSTMILTNNGKHLLMFNQYVYCKHCNQKQGIRWKCTRNASRNCNAYVIVNDAGIIVKGKGVHTHEPPKYHRNLDGTYIMWYVFSANFIHTSKGHLFVMINGYTFGKHYKIRTGMRWQCTQSHSRACKAYIVLDSGDRIIKSITEHSHDPPKYHYCPKNNSYTRF
ncbi:uncharacterized protein LOC128200148 [Galleria mellonella]|uniref:Uncharacterized protein LOC128200148 n=1 Tax=Galleria mellonella TaxID=7137 RepID=A0ABM3MBS5_GALME|nr:uncharacterized protein LOC128200148 [Galleria mellonella]